MELANAQSQDGESKGGVLAHLERLEIQLSKSHKKLEEPQREQAVESALGTKIHKLRLLRDKLSAELKQRQARVSRRVIDVGRLS
ncbi:Centromere protein O [Camelus dromedarius]|uniref:Centromere protein O n=1 Tax=Camelus dromedarius TaxID=9838 RepID=A0A5N4D6J8_CAMDR|nr:Centromere protein O [Camelus dromedarius]